MDHSKTYQVIQIFFLAALLSLPLVARAQDDMPTGDDPAAYGEAMAAAQQARAAAQAAEAAADEAREAAQNALEALDAQRSGAEPEGGEGSFFSVFAHAVDPAPNPKAQGIDGGSLRGTHGLQWPYFTESTIGVSGYVWSDVSYRKGTSTKDGEPDEKQALYQGRGVLRVSPTYVGPQHFFVQGQLEIVADKNQAKNSSSSDAGFTDDIWVKVGQWGKPHNNWDLQAGRMEAWALFNLGMGLDLNTLERKGAKVGNSIPPDFYGVTYMWGRPDSNLGNVALHYYPTHWLRFEGLFQTGFDTQNALAGRGAGVLDFGFIKIKGGGEYKKRSSRIKGEKNDEALRGFGGALHFVFDPWVEFGGHGAYALTDIIKFDGAEDLAGSNTTWSAGGFLNVNPLATVGAGRYLTVGGGFNYTDKVDLMEDLEDGDPGFFTHTQAFGAIQYRLFGKLLIKAVFAYAKGLIAAANAPENDTELLSGRLRLQYDF